VLALFEARYKSAGSPRIMVYWNRTLAPILPETPSTSITARERGDASLEASSSSSGDAAQARKGDLRWAEDYSTQVTLTGPATPLPDTARGGLAEAFDFAVEAGMQQVLRDAGAVLVDRNAVLRLTRLDNNPDAISLEMIALSKYADLLLEVLVTHDVESGTRWAYRVNLKDLRDGRLVAALYTEADPAVGVVRHRATSRGFVRERSSVKHQEIGRELGLQVLEETARQLR